MDVQKGLDRVVHIIGATKAANIHWRVVGKPIVDADPLVVELGSLCTIEPPVYSEWELTRLYCWADVVILPSRFEGVPLTAIEAMRCGAVMLVADAGGVNEIIDSNVDGLIVPQESCNADMVRELKRLESNREKALELSQAAMLKGKSRSWSKSLTGTLSFLEERIPKPPETKLMGGGTV
ncbi:hypothetical protein BK022_09910 [Methylorubrum extorquens]|uniref:Uncharacterized protein n=1 Tax=Methylorubrum extorquens TaxID=408 RepID=A0A1S1P808_METEX|nr:hypothetical protein BK022_09910 [Methylorubrum extorquens]